MPSEPSYLVGRYSEIENEIDNLDYLEYYVPINAAPSALKLLCRVPLQCKSYVHENDYVVYSSLLVAICVEHRSLASPEFVCSRPAFFVT